MHQATDVITTRFTFKPEFAADFLEDGQLVTQIDCDSIDEVMAYVLEFSEALEDACALVNGQVVSLLEETYKADEE